MTIRTAPRHTVTVQRKKKRDQKGTVGQPVWIDDGDPVEVRGNMHPVSTAEAVQFGLQTSDLRRFHSLTWPGDSHSDVYFEGALWETAGPAQHFDMSPRTTHWEVVLRRSQ